MPARQPAAPWVLRAYAKHRHKYSAQVSLRGSGGWEAHNFLFAPAEHVGGRHKRYFHIFLGAANQVPAAIQVELMFNVLAMTLNSFYTQIQRLRDLGVAKP